MITPTEVGKITPKNLTAGRQQFDNSLLIFQTSKPPNKTFPSGRIHHHSGQIIIYHPRFHWNRTCPISLTIRYLLFFVVRSPKANLTIGSQVYQPQYLKGFDDHSNKKSTAGFMFEGKHPTEDISCLQMKKWSKHLKAKHKSPQCWVFFFKAHSLLGASSHLVSG